MLIDTTMKYYVGIRGSTIDRARKASIVALGENSVANLLQTPKKCQIGKKDAVSVPSKLPDIAGVTEIGATGLEPATS
jgi:hypothetical protein